MGTLVQAPERASVEVSGLQAIASPTGKGGGLGTFLSGILPAINQEIDNYQKENKAHNLALGQNDKLNGMVREAGLLNRKDYSQGREYQGVINGQIMLAKDFQGYMDSLDPDEFDPDEVYKKGQEFTAQTIETINSSKLDPELKAQLYESNMKENASYMVGIDKKVAKFKDDAAQQTRVNELAALTLKLKNTDQTAAEVVVGIEAFIERRDTSLQLSNPEMSAEQRRESIFKDLDIGFTNLLDSVHIDGLDTDAPTFEHISALADHLVEIGAVDLANKVQTKSNEVYTDIREQNVARKEFTFSVTKDKWDADPALATEEDVKRIMGELSVDSSIPLADRLGLAAKYHNIYMNAQEKLLKAEVVLNPLQHSITSYFAMGKSEGDLVEDVAALILPQYANSPAEGGLALMNYGMDVKGEYSPLMVKKGAETFFRSLESYVRKTNAEVANDPYSQDRNEVFGKAMQMYQKYQRTSPEKARDLLSGVPENQIDAYAMVFEKGGTLEDVREALTSVVPVKMRMESIANAINDKTAIAKELALDAEFTSKHGGRFTKSMSDGVNAKFVYAYQAALTADQAYYADTESASSIKAMAAKRARYGADVKSPAGYNTAIFTIPAAKQMATWTSDNGVVMGQEFVGLALDDMREVVAKERKTSPSNIVITSDKNGSTINFQVWESGGWNGKGEPTLKDTATYSMARVKTVAQRIYKTANERKESQAGLDHISSNTPVGQLTVQDARTKQISTVQVPADYANALGGNIPLGKDWLVHMQYMESFTAQRLQTRDANSKRISYVYGQGMTEDTLTRMGMLGEAKAAVGNPQKMIQVQGKFMRKYYKDLPAAAKSVGVPMPTTGVYPSNMKAPLMLVLDEMWHNGSIYNPKNPSRSMHAAMNAKSYAAGEAILKRLNTYNRSSKKDTKRNRFMRNALKQHYKNRGLI